MTRRSRSIAVGVLGALAALVVTGTADAHIQVTPSAVAPSDPVRFTVLVPGESSARTTKVDLKVPPGLVPFSYEDVPGWKRRLVTAPDGSVDRIVWTGTLAPDGFVAFGILASTPEKPGSLTWKALQTYSDGEVARWIGSPGSDSPAPVTVVAADAPKQNAGGEGGGAEDATAGSGGTGATASADPGAAADAGGSDPDWVARGLGIAALLVAGVGLLALGRRRASRG